MRFVTGLANPWQSAKSPGGTLEGRGNRHLDVLISPAVRRRGGAGCVLRSGKLRVNAESTGVSPEMNLRWSLQLSILEDFSLILTFEYWILDWMTPLLWIIKALVLERHHHSGTLCTVLGSKVCNFHYHYQYYHLSLPIRSYMQLHAALEYLWGDAPTLHIHG